VIQQVSRGQLSHVTRADEERCSALEPAENLLRKLDGRAWDRHRVSGDRGLCPDPLCNGKGLTEQQVEHGAHGAGPAGHFEGVLDLPQDLRLADDH
jgi:hypothetical protein